MKRDKKYKINLDLNPITGFANEHKLYHYPKRTGKNEDPHDPEQEETEAMLKIDDNRMDMLLERLRWRGARKIRGYKFKGSIPAPKHTTDYLPWLKEE